MYGLIRLFIGVLICCCLILCFKRLKVSHKRKYYVFTVIFAVILTVILAFIPFENLFLTFDSPEQVLKYYYGRELEVQLVVDGKDSDLIIANNDNKDVYLIVPKTALGWKIGVGMDMKRIAQEIQDGVIVYIYQYKNTNEHFITVLDTEGGKTQILDSCNSKFSSIEGNNMATDKTFVTYYAYILDFTQEYWITINGEKLFFISNN